MFGTGWQQATARVVAGQYFESTGSGTAGMPSSTKLVLEVQPTDGTAAFRAKVTLHHLGLSLRERRMTPPREGEVVPVRFKPGTDKVEILLDDAHDARKQKHVGTDRLDAALHAPVGSAGAPGGSRDVDIVLQGDTTTTVEGDLPPGMDVAAILAQAGLDPAAAGTVTVNLGDVGSAAPPPVVSAADILATGTPGTATVQSCELVDQAGAPAGSKLLGIALRVDIPGRAAFDVANVYRTPDEKVAAVSLGATLPVKAHPVTQGMVAIDWSDVRA